MWTRAELKSKAKAVLRYNYWECVVAFIVYGAIALGASLVSSFIPIGGGAATIFVMLPMTVGLRFFFMQNQIAPANMQNIFHAFSGNRYMKIVGAMSWMYFFTVLWSMISMIGVFILAAKGLTLYLPYFMDYSLVPDFSNILQLDRSWIPALAASGIIAIAGMIIAYIKTLSYSMTPYILTDNPDIGYQRALKLSMAMTHGQKWEMFVLTLSFIGWDLLAVLTFGLGFLFLAPYVEATNAQLYVKLRDNAINNGLTSSEELRVFRVE